MRFPQPLISVMSVAIALSGLGAIGRMPKAMAQLPACAPPRAGEFLVLVLPQSNQDLGAIGDRLPSRVDAQACTYLDEVVLRIHGLEGQEDASILARQITEELGLNAFVTRPPTNTGTNTETQTATGSSSPAPTSSSSLNLPRVQVIEARPAGGRSPSRSQEQTQPQQEPSRGQSQDSRRERSRSSRRSDEDSQERDLDISLGELPPANLPDGSFDVPSPDTDPDDLPVYIPVEEGDRPLASPPQSQPQAMPEVAITSPPGRNRGYNPQPLEAGYAILVDYFNQPQVARDLQQATNRSVGLVSYGQRPYLLVGYSRDETEANALLQRLSEQGFWTMVVDSQRVMVLTPQVSLN
ncbi:hypothetical protein E1H12_07140 [Geitlerinema sp. P-1104]|uniref:hypothetical protein n=1 Tax=Geitlerinema sp. P-1104 TaxID=2546230 RepID=UPI0014769250|nr:hypothetical protein [Geitlerinema sp. P-1104]NMG58304.1 hypothetical protein [Geitlerinema sp. P-1104]